MSEVLERVGVPFGIREEVLRQVSTLQKVRSLQVAEETPCMVLPEIIRSTFLPVPDGKLPFSRETMEIFQVAYDPRFQRVVWPIRNGVGQLIGIAGRRPKEEERYGKYKIYQEELHDVVPNYTPAGLKQHLFGFHLLYPRFVCGEGFDVIVVEGFKACAAVYEVLGRCVLALLGNQLTIPQRDQLLRVQCRSVTLFLDNNSAGRFGTERIGFALNPHVPVFVFQYPRDVGQPDDLTETEIWNGFQSKVSFTEYQMKLGSMSNIGVAPKGEKGTSKFLRTEERFSPSAEKVRIRILDGKYEQNLFDHNQGAMVKSHLPFFLSRVHWSPFGVPASHLPYTESKWRGPLVCTSGHDPHDQQPCLGCYLSGVHVETPQGKRMRAVTTQVKRTFTVLVLGWFHTVPKVSEKGVNYTVLEPCKKSLSGRGVCPHCTADYPRQWGRRCHMEFSQSDFDQLVAFGDKLLSTGVCGCEIFTESFVCPSCKHTMINTASMSDAQVESYARATHRCPKCGFTGVMQEVLDCSKMTPAGQPITQCAGVSARTLFNSDIHVWTSENSQKKQEIRFEWVSSSPTPFCPQEIAADWPTQLEKLAVPIDLRPLENGKTIEEQAKHIGFPLAEIPQELLRQPPAQEFINDIPWGNE